MRTPLLGAATVAAAVLASTPAASAEDEGWKLGPGLELRNKKADFKIALQGYGQLDLVSLRNWETPDPTDFENDEIDVNRLRLGLEGEWRRLSFEIQGDLADDEDHMKDFWVGFRFAREVQLRLGNQKVPVGAEWLTSARRIDFVERSLLAENLAPGRDVGAVLHGKLGRRFEYLAGAFLGDGRKKQDRAETTGVARLIWTPVDGLELASSYAQGRVDAEPESGGVEVNPKGVKGSAFSTYDFFERKFVNGQRRRVGADASFWTGPLALKAEYLHLREERLGQGTNFEDLPAVIGQGWAVSATWLVAGKRKSKAVSPGRPLFHGPGAIELSARFDHLDFDDEAGDSGFAGAGDRSRNLRPARDRALSGGISWWPVRYVRLMADVVAERFEDPLLAPEPGRTGDYVTFLARLQFELP